MIPLFKKHIHRLLRGLALTVLGLMACYKVKAQMDTLFFEDFVDNRRNWDISREDKWQKYIEDGYLCIDVKPGNNAHPYASLEYKLTNPDWFIYEVKIIPEDLRFGGLTYKYHYRNPEKQGTKRLCCYQAFVADQRGLFHFQHVFRSDIYDGKRVYSNPDMDRSAHVLRVELRDGMIRLYHNGELMHTEENKVQEEDPWRYWGFMSRGKAKFKVDYMLLMGSKN